MLSYEAERRAYLGEDPADIVADEMQAAAVRAAVLDLGFHVETALDLLPVNEEAWRAVLYPWSRNYIERS